MDSDTSSAVEGNASLIGETARRVRQENILKGLIPTKDTLFFIKDNKHIYEATTDNSTGEIIVKYHATVMRDTNGNLDEIIDNKELSKNPPKKITKAEKQKYDELYKELVKVTNEKDEKYWFQSTKEEEKTINTLKDQIKKNPFGELQSDMRPYVGGKKTRRKKNAKRKPRKSKKNKSKTK